MDLERDLRDDFLLLERFGDLERLEDFLLEAFSSLDLDLERRDDFLSPDLRRIFAGLGERDFEADRRFELFLSLPELDRERCLLPDSELRRRRLFSFSGSTFFRSWSGPEFPFG